jgi:UPF0271 protein
MPVIDLNADVGEGFGRWSLGDDDALVPLVTSANVACGFHAGDPSTLRRTCELAVAHGVAIGAQVSYPDLVGFGRRFIDIAPDELVDAVVYQVGGLRAIARAAGGDVAYLKPHGALYHACTTHPDQAEAVIRASRLAEVRAVLGAPGSPLLAAAAREGLDAVPEGFVDRGYRADGSLVPRSAPGAVLGVDAAVRQAERLIAGEVTAVDGTRLGIAARSLCVHGDGPEAVAIARAVRSALAAAGVSARSFAA